MLIALQIIGNITIAKKYSFVTKKTIPFQQKHHIYKAFLYLSTNIFINLSKRALETTLTKQNHIMKRKEIVYLSISTSSLQN